MNKVTQCAFFDELEKIGFDWHKFREGVVDEGIPLAGATVGAAAGGLRGAALGYAAGGAASIARSKLKGEDPSLSRKLLAAGALGYGAGGLGHWGLEHLTAGMAQRAPTGLAAKMFHAPGAGTVLSRGVEEILPAAGATLGTGLAMGMHKEPHPQTQPLQKLAIDPVTLAGGLAAGKVMAANALARHGMKIAPIRRLGQEIAGVGFRTAQQGKPMLSQGMREAMAIGVDPKLTGLYEAAHAAGSNMHSGHVGAIREMAQKATSKMPEMAQHAKFIEGIPTQSTGLRKVVDYGFTPVSQVAQDVKGLASRAAQRLRPASLVSGT